MTNEEKAYIEQYLDNKMTLAAQQRFEARLESDPDFAKKVDFVRLERVSIDLIFEQDLRKKMKNWKTQNTEGGVLKYKTAILTTLLLLGLGFLLYWLNQKHNNHENKQPASNQDTLPIQNKLRQDTTQQIVVPIANSKTLNEDSLNKSIDKNLPQPINKLKDLAIANYEKPNILASDIRTGSNHTTNEVEKIIADLFNNNDFKKLIIFLDKNPFEDKSYMNYLKGHAYFNLKNFKEAEINFKQALLTPNLERKERAFWFLSLSLLANGKKNEFLTIIQDIIKDNDGLYNKKAIQVKKSLDLNY